MTPSSEWVIRGVVHLHESSHVRTTAPTMVKFRESNLQIGDSWRDQEDRVGVIIVAQTKLSPRSNIVASGGQLAVERRDRECYCKMEKPCKERVVRELESDWSPSEL